MQNGSGDDMLAAVFFMTHFAPESIVRARSTLVKARYLKRIKKLLATQPEIVSFTDGGASKMHVPVFKFQGSCDRRFEETACTGVFMETLR